MQNKRMPGLFIAGTDTGVGKTHTAAMIVRALRAAGQNVGVYKPAGSGCSRDPQSGELVCEDALALWRAAGEPGELTQVCPQRFAAALTPHRAAEAEGRTLDAALVRRGLDVWRERDVVIVEGAGGLFSPLGTDELNIDVAAEFGFPIVIVTANRLGTIHATLATLHAAVRYRDDVRIAGVVLNELDGNPDDDASRMSNAAELQTRLDAPLLAIVGYRDENFRSDVDWLAVARGSS
jgi:dethiobiotin synthetase